MKFHLLLTSLAPDSIEILHIFDIYCSLTNMQKQQNNHHYKFNVYKFALHLTNDTDLLSIYASWGRLTFNYILVNHHHKSTPPPEFLTYICHVHAVLRGGVVPAGGDGGHVHAVHGPYGRVAAVEVAAVGAPSHIVWTFTYTVSTPANTKEKKNLYMPCCTEEISAEFMSDSVVDVIPPTIMFLNHIFPTWSVSEEVLIHSKYIWTLLYHHLNYHYFLKISVRTFYIYKNSAYSSNVTTPAGFYLLLFAFLCFFWSWVLGWGSLRPMRSCVESAN